jgi:diaminopimelate decarboxylase
MSTLGLTRVNNFFTHRGGELFVEDIPIRHIAAVVDTPFYVYSASALRTRFGRFAAAFAAEQPLICYAVKANSNLAVLRLFATLGAGADVVSEGELRRALAAGIPPERIVFSGVGKSRNELAAAVAAGIHQINVESLPELDALSQVATKNGRIVAVALRVNPDVDAGTHVKLTTGKKENKFGIDIDSLSEAYRLAARLPGIEPVGLAMHIGSQLTDPAPFRAAFTRLAELVVELRAQGLSVRRLDLGGGLGIRYRAETPPEPSDYAALVREAFAGLGVSLAFEPGRWMCGPAGVLVARVLYVKEGATKRFVVVDAAMNDLIRPAMYGAWHDIVPVRLPKSLQLARADVVGPVCEPGDAFAVERALPPLSGGDLIAFTAAGAYGAVMSSTYNSRLLVPEVLVAGDRSAVIRARPSYEALLSLDKIPNWIDEPIVAQPPKRGAA